MATTTELVDLICADTGLDTSGTDRAAALARLNHANRQIIQQAGGLPATITLTTPAIGTTDLDLSSSTVSATLASRFLSLDRVRTVTAGVTSDALVRERPQVVRELQNAGSVGSPAYYSFVYPNLMLDRDLDGATDVVIDARLGPLSLVESGPVAGTSETAPTSLPAIWHERLLASLACVLVLERYEGRENDASYHRGLYNEALVEYRYNRYREGGEGLPAGANLWTTPDITAVR